jgi:hypothetical protein
MIYVGFGVRNVFETPRHFDEKAGGLKASLMLFQDWNRFLRLDARSRSSSKARDSKSRDRSRLDGREEALRSYLYIRKGVFSGRSLIREYMDRSPGQSEVTIWGSEERCYLGIIVALSCVLYSLRDAPKEASAFLAELDHTLRLTVRTNTLAQLPGMMWICTMGYCARKVGLWKSSDDCPYRLWEIVESVDIIMSASIPTREKVVRAMVSWLVCELEDDAGLALLKEKDLEAFVADASAIWTLARVH